MCTYTRAYADCRGSCLYFCRRLCPAHTRAYADCRRQSSNMLNFQGQRRHSSQSRKRPKVSEGRRIVLHRDVCGGIPTHTLTCLYFYPRRNLRYAVAACRQRQAWTSAPAAAAYARMEYKPGFIVSWHQVITWNKVHLQPVESLSAINLSENLNIDRNDFIQELYFKMFTVKYQPFCSCVWYIKYWWHWSTIRGCFTNVLQGLQNNLTEICTMPEITFMVRNS